MARLNCTQPKTYTQTSNTVSSVLFAHVALPLFCRSAPHPHPLFLSARARCASATSRTPHSLRSLWSLLTRSTCSPHRSLCSTYPLPHVSDHVFEPQFVLVGEAVDGGGAFEAVLGGVVLREVALPNVCSVRALGRELVAPREQTRRLLLVLSPPRRVLPLGLRRQPELPPP